MLLCIYPVQPVYTSLAHPCLYYYLLSLLLSCTLFYCTFYLIFYSFLLVFFFPYQYLCIFSCVCVTYNCTVHGADLTYISLLVIFCIIMYVTNTNLESYLLLCHIFEKQSPNMKTRVWKLSNDKGYCIVCQDYFRFRPRRYCSKMCNRKHPTGMGEGAVKTSG